MSLNKTAPIGTLGRHHRIKSDLTNEKFPKDPYSQDKYANEPMTTEENEEQLEELDNLMVQKF